jgi:U2 small nuclear ribonucleoprotein B''
MEIVMKQTLRALFKNYGEVLDVVAHANLRMRGQAFVSFPDVEAAQNAQREVKGFPLYGKPMVFPPSYWTRSCTHTHPQQITFARTRSDVVVKKLDGENFTSHKERREEHKSKLDLLTTFSS